ncbi:MAG: TlpA family protein disulfide reductase, partial [Acidobacteriota bacterium]
LMLRRPGQGSAVLPGDGAAGMAAPRLSDGTSRPTLNRRREARGVVPPLQGAVARGPQSAGRDSVVSQAAVAVGDKFIDFTLPRIGGGEVTLHDLVGKPIFLDFWATWCAPCRAEAPGLAEIYKRYGEKIQMLGISLDFNATQPLDYAVSFGLGYPHLMTRGSWKDPVVQAYGIHRTGIPFNILMDASGRIVAMDLHGLPLARAMERLAGDTESR